MEYIRVEFDRNDIRDVIANGNPIGETESDLALPTNYYRIRLSGDGYEPALWEGNVAGTLPERPLIITFHGI